MPKGVIAEYPYNNFYIYIVFHKKRRQKICCLVPSRQIIWIEKNYDKLCQIFNVSKRRPRVGRV